jgi:hypothetical protein
MVSDKVHCLDLSTEVLTKSGWKTYKQLTMDDLIATLKDGKLVYDKPIDIMVYPDYEGSMYYIKNQGIDLAVTGNHRMWVSLSENGIYDFARADDIVGKSVRYKKDAEWEQEEFDISDDDICGTEFPEKLSKRQALIFIKQFLNYQSSGDIMFTASSKTLADKIQQLCLHIGWSCNIINDVDIYIYYSSEVVIDNKSSEKFVEREKCPVFCLQVPSEVFYVRRNGKTCWTGNSRAMGHVTTLVRQPLEGRSREGGKNFMPQWYLKILLVRVVTGNIFKFRGSLEILFKIEFLIPFH